MIQISSLWSLNNIEDYYYVVAPGKVINANTGYYKKATKSKQRGYWYFTLQTKDKKQQKVYVHKINALAFINNGPYILIEHINDDKDNNNIENLTFSNQSNNVKNAFINKRNVRNEKVFIVVDIAGNKYKGTAKEISRLSNIPLSTIYYLALHNKSKGKKVKYIEEVKQAG